MSRGNIIDVCDIIKVEKFGFTILRIPKSSTDYFTRYSKMYISNGGRLIGVWGSSYTHKDQVKRFSYKDILVGGLHGKKIARICRSMVILK